MLRRTLPLAAGLVQKQSADRVVYEIATSICLKLELLPRPFYEEGIAELGEQRVVELVGVLGYYTFVSMTLVAFEIGLPEDLQPELADTALPQDSRDSEGSERMNVDLKIAGGTIIDPERGINAQGDVLIRGNTIVEAAAGRSDRCSAATIDARGCLVLPGLIDFHAHLYGGGTESGVHADSALLPMGVTTAIDAGSCGSANYESFVRTAVAAEPGAHFQLYQHFAHGTHLHSLSRNNWIRNITTSRESRNFFTGTAATASD